MSGSLIFECDACSDKRVGFSRTELLAQGWKWHAAGRNEQIVVCDACVRRFAARRQKTAA